MITESRFMGTDALHFETERVSVVFLPELGGKLVSLFDRQRSFEFLFQNPRGVFRRAARGASFEDFEACGFDDAFPNIDAETVEFDGRLIDYPDHGEIWSARFNYEILSDEKLSLYWKSPTGYFYRKTFSPLENGLRGEWLIRNDGGYPLPCIWAFHFLAVYRESMRVVFPPGTRRVRNVLLSDRLGEAGLIYDFPFAETARGRVDFTKVPPVSANAMEKIYVDDRVDEGLAGYDYPDENASIRFRYDPAALPYLGFWITVGAFRGDYNLALEPTNGFYDKVSTARRFGRLKILSPGETFMFGIDFLVG